jgi:hypothetical protein
MTNAHILLKENSSADMQDTRIVKSPLERKVMVSSKVVIYSSNLMLKLHNVFSDLGEVLSSQKKTLSLLIFVSTKIKSGSTLFRA